MVFILGLFSFLTFIGDKKRKGNDKENQEKGGG